MLPSEEEKLRKWIRTVPYLNQERTTQDVTRTVSFYRGLQIRFEPYVMTNGRSLQLLNLEGVIPVPVNGTTYNIPVSIWLMDTYPNHAPVCFVKPTADMQIKVSMFVDHNGKIYLPYLHDWTPTQSDLLGLIQVMICTFGEQPPVYARPKADDHHSAQPSPYPTQPYMPMPGVSGGGGGNPSYPPYPMSQGYPVPYPPPVYPPTAGMYPPAYSSQPQPTPPSSVGGTNTINEEHIRASLLSAVEEKLRRRLDEQFAQARAELDILQQTGTELHQGKVKLEKIIERLDTDKSELDRNVMVLREKEAELDAALARLDAEADGGGQIDVDEAVTTTTPLYKQILNAFAEEAATEDAIYYMGEALRRGVIDLDVFLKQVRSLSRKQFTLRALMHKCRLKAGLAG